MPKRCIGIEVTPGVGFKPGVWETCGRPPGPRNPHWCNDCDDIRMQGITQAFGLAKRLLATDD